MYLECPKTRSSLKNRGSDYCKQMKTIRKECNGKKRAASNIRAVGVSLPSLALALLSVVIAYARHSLYRSLYFADLARHRVLVD